MKEDKVLRCFRYVDDFLIILEKNASLTYVQTVQDVLTKIKLHGKGLDFTFKLPVDNKLQFLDSNVTLKYESICWMYCPRMRKELLLYHSTHYKTVKRAIALMRLQVSLKKSCPHKLRESFEGQVQKLKKVGYPTLFINTVVEGLLKKVKNGKKWQY